MPARRAAVFTTCQIAFGVIPSPQILPNLFTRRKIRPVPIPATSVHSSTARFAQAGTGSVRICFPLPMRSAITQCSSRICRSSVLRPTSSALLSPHPTKQRQDGAVALAAGGFQGRRLQQCSRLIDSQPIANPDAQALCAFDTPDTRRQFGAQEAGVGGFVSKSPHRGQAHVDCGGSELFCSRKNRYRSTTVRLNAKRGSEQYQPMNSSIA
jgi:hypothetical protein